MTLHVNGCCVGGRTSHNYRKCLMERPALFAKRNEAGAKQWGLGGWYMLSPSFPKLSLGAWSLQYVASATWLNYHVWARLVTTWTFLGKLSCSLDSLLCSECTLPSPLHYMARWKKSLSPGLVRVRPHPHGTADARKSRPTKPAAQLPSTGMNADHTFLNFASSLT